MRQQKEVITQLRAADSRRRPKHQVSGRGRFHILCAAVLAGICLCAACSCQ
jgi:hypothetical protein